MRAPIRRGPSGPRGIRTIAGGAFVSTPGNVTNFGPFERDPEELVWPWVWFKTVDGAVPGIWIPAVGEPGNAKLFVIPFLDSTTDNLHFFAQINNGGLSTVDLEWAFFGQKP